MKAPAEFDFGFSIVSEQELRQYEQQLETELVAVKNNSKAKLDGLKNMYAPLLENLKKDPNKTYIYWPNRTKTIEQFMANVEKYIEDNSKD